MEEHPLRDLSPHGNTRRESKSPALDEHNPNSTLLRSRGDVPAPQTQSFRDRFFHRKNRSNLRRESSGSYDDHDVVSTNRDKTRSAKDQDTRPIAVPLKSQPFHAFTWDLFGVLLSGCFLALGICIANLKDKSESAWSKRVVEASQVAPSIWPIVFSGILGNAIRALADYRVERGIALLNLEQLLGSLTLAGSIATTFRWSVLRLSSLALIILWAFNPLGSQASLRGAYLQPVTGHSQGRVTYYDPNFITQMQLFNMNGGSDSSATIPIVYSLYSSTLYDPISSTQYVDPANSTVEALVSRQGGNALAGIQAATDTWGNVRIPSLIYHADYDRNNPHKWIETPWDQRILNYSCLIGDRLDGLDRTITGNTSFTITSSLQQLNCSPWLQLDTDPGDGGVNDTQADHWLQNYTGKKLRDLLGGTDYTFFISYPKTDVNPDGVANGTIPEIVFGSNDVQWQVLSLTTCTSSTLYVDANISCASNGASSKMTCGVGALRETPNPPGPSNYTVLNPSLKVDIVPFFQTYIKQLIAPDLRASSFESYLYDPLSIFNNEPLDFSFGVQVNLSAIDIGTFERRFSLVFNSVWKAWWALQSAIGWNMTYYSPYALDPTVTVFNTSDQWTYVYVQNTTSDITFALPPIYAIDIPWLITYFVSVFVMFLTAIFALVVRSRCRAPAVLGYVSSLTRDSIYFQDCGLDASSTETGPQRSQRLAGLKIMLADVDGDTEGPGKIALTPASIGRRVEKGKDYI